MAARLERPGPGSGRSATLQCRKYTWELEEKSLLWGTEVYDELFLPKNVLIQGANHWLRASCDYGSQRGLGKLVMLLS